MGGFFYKSIYAVLSAVFLFLCWQYASMLSAGASVKPVSVVLSGNWQRAEEDEASSHTMFFRGHIEDDVPAGQDFMMFFDHMAMELFVNGELVHECDSHDYTGWESFISPGLSSSDELEVVLYTDDAVLSPYDAADSWQYSLCTGSLYGLLLSQLANNASHIIIGLLLLAGGLGFFIVRGMLAFFRFPLAYSYVSCGLLMIFGALCSLIDYEYITLLFPWPLLINFIDYLLQFLICEMLLLYLFSYLCQKKHIRLAELMIMLWTGIFLFYCCYGWNGHLVETGFLLVAESLVLLFLGCMLVFLWQEYGFFPEKNLRYVIWSTVVLVFCTAAEIIHYSLAHRFWIYVFQIGLAFFSFVQGWILLQYINQQVQQGRRVKYLEKKLLENKMDMLLSQIRPHFIFNVLNAIGGLCLRHPEQADAAIVDFSNYLRANMIFLQDKRIIAFQEEMRHISYYLAMEKLRFGDKIKFWTELEIDDFSLPALTIEPLVENAVKHGVSCKAEGGEVVLTVRQEKEGIIIVIKDDGVGFDPEAQQSGSHSAIGLENVRTRLSYMMGATLTIESALGRGTCISVYLPSQMKEIDSYEDNIC